MSNNAFFWFIEYINTCLEIPNEDYEKELWVDDKGWEYEAAKFYGYNAKDIEENNNLPL